MSIFEKVVPAPLSSVALLVVWLVLARSTSIGHVFLGLALAVALPLLTTELRPKQVRVQRPRVIVRYFVTVCSDVLLSNFKVAWGVLAGRWQRPRSKFVIVPLDLRDPMGLAALAMVTTIVPGTVWAELSLDRSALLLHVWHVTDEDAFIARFKARYERPLKEIFE